MTIRVRDFKKQNPQLSQSSRLMFSESEAIGGVSKATTFTRTMRASLTTQELISVGTGVLDPLVHTRLMTAYAIDQNRPLSELVDQYFEALIAFGGSSERYRRVLAGIMGVGERPERALATPKVTPTFVHSLVAAQIPNVDIIIQHLMTDFVCHMLAPMNWVMEDASYVYKVNRGPLYPTFSSLVDIITARDLAEALTVLASADLRLIKQSIAGSATKISPAVIARHLAQETTTAFSLSQSSYDSEAIVSATLDLLKRIWTPFIPDAMAPAKRVLANPLTSELSQNLGLFIAMQDMVQNHQSIVPAVFGDEELASQVIPAFHSAISQFSPFKVEPIENAVAFLGKQSSQDHLGAPTASILYESWEFGDNVEAFTTVKHLSDSRHRYLMHEPATSTALSTALKPINQFLTIERLVDSRLATFDIQYASSRMPTLGSKVILGLPSIMYGVGKSNWESATAMIEHDVEGPWQPEEAQAIRDTTSDVYNTLLHLAVVRAESVAAVNLGSVTGTTDSTSSTNLGLVFSVRTHLLEPLGDAAITQGMVATVEPIELLSYVPDFTASTKLSVKEFDVKEHEGKVHIWPWFDVSVPLDYKATFHTDIRNYTVATTVSEHEMLGLGVKRKEVRMMIPVIARAFTNIWLEWIRDEIDDLTSFAASTKDTTMQLAVNGRKTQLAMELALGLVRVGSSGAAANAGRLVRHKIAEQLYASGNIDDFSQFHAGIQRHRMSIWAGASAMKMLELITDKQYVWMLETLRDHDALGMIVAMDSQPQ